MDLEPTEEFVEFNLRLKVGETRATVGVQVPTREMTAIEFLPVLQDFDNALVSLAELDAAGQGRMISCRAGCGACCRQLVPISEPEAHQLAALVAALPDDRRAEVTRRFDTAVGRLEAAGMLEKAVQLPTATDKRFQSDTGLEYFRMGIACPFLEEESCSIHPDRPLACREFIVTSPAENCAHPDRTPVTRVRLPGQLSHVVYETDGFEVHAAPRWMPLVTALRWAAAHRDDPQPRSPGPELFRRFIGHLREEP